MAESSKGLPQLSSAAWGALLASGLIALVLGVYPVVVYPVLMKTRLSAATSPLIYALRSPSLAFAFAGVSVALFVLAVSGRRAPDARNRLAYTSAAVAVVGLVALFVGIYGAAR